MSYDFSKLSRVPINDSVTDETYTLVVNQDEVERTPYGNIVSNIQDYTEDYNTYSLEHPGTSPVDFIRTLTPIRVDTQTVPRQGYLTYMYFYYTFEVFCSTNSTWYKITEVNSNQNKLTEYLYNSTALVEQVQKNYNAANPTSGTRFVTPVEFDDIRELNCSGNVDIDGNLNVNGDSSFGNVRARRLFVFYGDNSCEIEETSILFSGDSTDVMLYHDGNGNLVVSENGSDTKITGLSSPTGSSDAANKQYVDTNVAELNGRINNLIVGGDSTEGEEIVVDVINNVQISETFVAQTTVILSGENTKLISVAWSFSGNNVWRTENVEYINATGDGVHYNLVAYNLNDFVGSSYVKFMVIYSRKANLIVPELADLRTPYDYIETIEDYSTSYQYTVGEYCWYPNSSTGKLYICIDQTDGEWDSSCWSPVTARTSIDEALKNRLLIDGSIPMTGDLDLNGTNKIINLATPTTGTDAATKAYVDNKTFSLDANGILSFG